MKVVCSYFKLPSVTKSTVALISKYFKFLTSVVVNKQQKQCTIFYKLTNLTGSTNLYYYLNFVLKTLIVASIYVWVLIFLPMPS